ncbi:RNA-binding domain-containing protein [Trichoderma citrinoviride]|uniref:RNA-binding domain-containing protein n=1 Tax=Trichoderma citrinoviride TaxID=58853 RepID=A0A2T4B2M6_9HYPO|nr:RNA-binding domain-containing protein [Trichoderma citrinoviride]PTB63572.1 RNA-binding domain-containing protein [Trichoderma citrinoviride]
MATTAMDYEAANGDRYEDEAPRYERDNRSASPRPARDDAGSRRRSMSPSGADSSIKDAPGPKDDDDGAINPGSNLFVTGIHPRLSEAEVSKMFEKYGEVEKCQIMRDPHTKESRGFGFVKMVTSEQAEAAKEGLQGEVIEGRTMSIEKARRARPRTPTPGKYFGPPKRDPRSRFDERRRGGYGGGGYSRDDYYRYRGNERGYDRNYERGYDRRYEERGAGGGGSGSGSGYDRSYRDDRRYDDRSYAGRDSDRSYDRGYERRDRDDNYGRERYGNSRDDRGDRYGARGGNSSGGGYDRDRYERTGDRDGGRSREPAASGGPAYGEPASRPEARESYGGSI